MNEEKEFGIVTEIYYPLVKVHGIPTVAADEMVEFEGGAKGVAFSLFEDSAEILLLQKDGVKVGDRVKPMRTEPVLQFSNNLLGTVIGPLGDVIRNDKKETEAQNKVDKALDTRPAGIALRAAINSPFITGITVVDLLLPLGFGQKELIIGDRKSGKTSFLLTVLKNQAVSGTKIIYAAIGKRRQEVEGIYEYLVRENLLSQTVVVSSFADDSPSLIYLTPLTAMTIAEAFKDQGIQTLVIFDDLSNHAKFYREVSLLAGRFPGRESYPGDMFHVHARLLERAGNFKLDNGSVSITALPVVEVHQGDLTSHIATNLMSITDGHIFLDSNIFFEGRRPAVNVPISVTRVGRQATSKLVRSINREVSSFLSLYDKMRELSHFGAELTDTVKNILNTGDALYRFFEQERGTVVPQKVQVTLFALIWLKTFDDLSNDSIKKYRQNLITSLSNTTNDALINEILSVESLNELLTNINKNLDTVKKLCV